MRGAASTDVEEHESEVAARPARRVRPVEAPRIVLILALVLSLVALVFAGWRLSDYRESRDRARNDAEDATIAAAQASAASIDQLLTAMQASVDLLAENLSAGRIDDRLEERLSPAAGDSPTSTNCRTAQPDATELEPALCAAALSIPELNGIGAVFAESVDPGHDYRPYANRISGSLRLGELVQRDFETTDWFVEAVADDGAWTEPRFGLTSQKLLAYYSAPFRAADGSLRGVLLATYALDRLAADLQWLSVGSTGYSIVFDKDDRLISHPAAALVNADVNGEPIDSAIVSSIKREIALDDDRGFLPELTNETGSRIKDDVSNADVWVAFDAIPTDDWTFGAVVVEREVFRRTAEQTRLMIDIGLALSAAILFGCVVLFRAHRGGTRGLWAVSITMSLLAMAGIGLVWYVTITGPGEDVTEATEVPWPSAPTETPPGTPEPLFAGVFVQSVEFTGSNDVTVSGIVWQEQRSDERGAEPPGFVFPEADDATFAEVYRSTQGNLTRIGWSFTASLRQVFDYSRYPLDRETVWLRLWPADYSAPWLMFPELTSYETLAPSTNPGIEKEFVVEGWELESSSFSYRNNPYNTDFGLRDLATDPTPELYFNVHLKRSFIDALMSQLVPLTVVIVLLFSVLLISTKRHASGEELEFSALGVLSYCAALFFVVILAHANLRDKLRTESVIYIEYFYFAAYIAILLVSANAILLGVGRGGRLIQNRDNMIPSLLFWPVLNSSLLVVTLLSFY